MQSIEEERRKAFDLTPPELEIVSAVLAGYSNKEIAEYFKMGEDDVKLHLNNLFDRAGVSTRLEPAIFVQRLQMWTVVQGKGASIFI